MKWGKAKLLTEADIKNCLRCIDDMPKCERNRAMFEFMLNTALRVHSVQTCEEVGDFGVCGAINTIRKQFIGLGVAGYMSLEIKWDERFQLFLPHVHALVMGMTVDKLKDGLKAIHPNNEKRCISRVFFKSRQNVDTLALSYENSIKQVKVETVNSSQDVITYMTKTEDLRQASIF